MHASMKSRMDAEGLPYGKRTHTYNSRLAQELAKWADTALTDSRRVHDELYRAYFVDARNIGDPEILVDVAGRAGAPVEEAAAVLANRTFSHEVDADWTRARSLGVSGVPTFAAAGQGVVGAQPYEMLEKLVVAVGAEKRGS